MKILSKVIAALVKTYDDLPIIVAEYYAVKKGLKQAISKEKISITVHNNHKITTKDIKNEETYPE